MGIDVWIMDGDVHPLKRFHAILEDAAGKGVDDQFERDLIAEMNGPRHLRECYGGFRMQRSFFAKKHLMRRTVEHGFRLHCFANG